MIINEVARQDERERGRNQLLTGLSSQVASSLRADLTRVHLDSGKTLYEVGDTGGDIYFPETAVAAIDVRMRDGSSVPVFTVGNEGMIGVTAILGNMPTSMHASVIGSGSCLKLSSAALPRVGQHQSIRRMMQRYVVAFLGSITQLYACERAHNVLQRCAMQLLMTSDRQGGADLLLTQEMLAGLLGLRRVNVGIAAQQLQRLGCIEYVRGKIRVRDRSRLESSACHCYRLIRGYLSASDAQTAGRGETLSRDRLR
jgi:CRP-like cAMP-binding protein